MPLRVGRVGFIQILILTLVVSASPRANQAGARWYDAYDEGVKAIQAGDWATAENRLVYARSRGPKPARRVLRYGDSYAPFLPDYYLGIVYLNTGRPQEAEAAFAQVNSQKLIGPKDPEFSQFQRQTQQATADRLLAADAKQMASNPTTTTTPPASAPPPARTPIAVPPATNDYSPAGAAASNTDTKADQPISTQAPIQQPVGASRIPPGVSTPNASAVPSTVVDTKRPPPPIDSRVTGQAPSPSMRNGLVAFFSGDYVGAIQWLERAAQEGGGSPRARLFLACAKAGLVLTGGGNADLLRTARLEFQSGDPQRNLPDAQRRFISPRVLEQLEKP